MVKQLQIIVHLLLMNVILPSSTAAFFSKLVGILTFDPIEITDQIGQVAYIPIEKEVDSPNFRELEYSSPFALINFGSLCLFVSI